MATQPEGEASQQTTSTPEGEGSQRTISTPATSLTELVHERYQEMKEHAETYPYVWASYTLVYGTLGLWLAYRWRKLRKTEDRVRALHKRLYKLYENEEAATSKAPISAKTEEAANSAQSISKAPIAAKNEEAATSSQSISKASTSADKPPR